jgi:hypothetical protein
MDLGRIESEWMYHNRAFKAGVPVAPPVLAKMLHCDWKPANLRWSNGVVRLIDFEHAQDISDSAWAPDQEPEILNGKPCTIRTDAFAVGAIIANKIKNFPQEKRHSESHHTLWDVLIPVPKCNCL